MNDQKPVNGCTYGGRTIGFSVSGTIKLVGSALNVNNDMTITGPAGGITLDGLNQTQIMHRQQPSRRVINLQNLTIINGFTKAEYGGGGIFSASTLNVTNCTFSSNEASRFPNDAGGRGGAISSKGPLTIVNSIFSANKAVFGGAIFQNGNDETLSVDRSTFSENSATIQGGAISAADVANRNITRISNSSFSGNTALQGGGINALRANLTIVNSTFAANSAADGAAVFNERGAASVTNSTFSGNLMNTGAVVNSRGNKDKLTVTDSLLAGSQGTNCLNSIANGGSNISDDASCAFGSTTGANGQSIGDNVANPGLDPAGLEDNGGPTETIGLDPTSIAINAVLKAACPAKDQRGLPRPGKPNSVVAACDVGAFELQ